jgi:hypothetical protein
VTVLKYSTYSTAAVVVFELKIESLVDRWIVRGARGGCRIGELMGAISFCFISSLCRHVCVLTLQDEAKYHQNDTHCTYQQSAA